MITYFGTRTNLGNGDAKTTVLAWPAFSVIQSWSDWQLNTCEAALIIEDRVFTTTYGFQLNTYDQSGGALESAFPFFDRTSGLPVPVRTRRFE